MSAAPTPRARAEQEAEEARARIMATAAELATRFKPAHVAGELWSRVRTRGEKIGEDAGDFVRARPVAVGVAAAGALALAAAAFFSGRRATGGGSEH